MKVAIHVSDGRFFIVKWEDDSFKWDGYSFRELGYSYESAKSFGSEREVVAACKHYGFTVEALLSGFPKEKEGNIWDEIQVLLEA